MYTKRGAWSILIAVFILTCWLGYRVSLSGFDYEFEKFFPAGNDDTEFFERFRSDFENDYDFFLVGIEREEGVFNGPFLQKAGALADSLAAIPGIISVISPTSIRLPVLQGTIVAYRPLLHPENPQLLASDSVRIYETGEFLGSFFSEDGRSICIFVQTREQMAKKPSDVLLKRVEASIAASGIDGIHVAGKLKAQQVYLSRMQEEVVFFLSAAILLVVIFLTVSFRSLWAVVVPVLVVVLAIIWQMGIMQLLGKKIDILIVIVATILFVVGMSDVIHIVSGYIEKLREGHAKPVALRMALREVGFATFLTAFTTSVGFFTLITSHISPVREFGIYTSMGVMIAFLLSVTLLPAVLIVFPVPSVMYNERSNRAWQVLLRKLFLWILRHPRTVAAAFCLVVVISIIGASRLRVNTFLLEDFREHEPLKKEFRYFENKFSGSRPFELVVEVQDTSKTLFDPEIAKEIAKLETGVRQHFETGFVQSPLTFVRFYNRASNSGLNRYFTIPESDSALNSLTDRMKKAGVFSLAETQKFLSDDLKKGRLSGRMGDVGSYRAGKMEREFLAQTSRTIDHSLIRYRLTGSARLVDTNMSYLAVDMVEGELIAFVIISLLFAFIFRSARMLVIALIPNIVPLVVIAGVMGFSGIDLKFSTAIVFTIAFGIAVDDTIHFLSRYRIERGYGKSLLYGLKRSYLSTGKAMILTTFVLCTGFASMAGSGFLSVFYIGLLITITLLTAMLSDLFLLPVLLVYMSRKKDRKGSA